MAVASGPLSASTDVERAMFEFVDAYNHAYEEAAREHGLSVAHACVLGRLGTQRAMGELAEELRCDASNITQIVARLEARSLAQRQPSPDDRRSRQILRTPDGDALNDAFEQSFDFARAGALPLSVDEQKQLASLLRRVLAGQHDEATDEPD